PLPSRSRVRRRDAARGPGRNPRLRALRRAACARGAASLATRVRSRLREKNKSSASRYDGSSRSRSGMQTSSGPYSEVVVSPADDGCAPETVAFVASAGGVQALGEVLAALPQDLGAALIVVLHLLPEHQSHLAAILGRQTTLRVKEAEDGDL